MRDIDRLEDEFRTGRLLRPSVDVLNVVDLGNAMASAAGASVRPMTKGAETVAGLIGPADHLVFVVADGFGMALVECLDAGAFPRRHAAATLHTVFPSTTASAFTSMATGEWPSRHAAVGWYTYVPQVDAVTTIIPFVRSIDDSPLTDLGLTVSEALPVPSLLAGIARPSLSFLPEPLEGSTFSVYLSGGTPRRGYSSLAQAAEAIAARVRTPRHRPSRTCTCPTSTPRATSSASPIRGPWPPLPRSGGYWRLWRRPSRAGLGSS